MTLFLLQWKHIPNPTQNACGPFLNINQNNETFLKLSPWLHADNTHRTQANNPKETAELFNRYFTSVFTTDTDACRPCTTNSTQDVSDNHDLPANNLLSDLILDNTKVLSVLKSIDVNKATGPDDIPARILGETAEEIAPSLCELFNKSLSLGILPDEWKCANIIPVFKKDNKEHVESYRPISLLSLASKAMERCVFNAIKEHVYSLIGNCQHGFITGRSCVTLRYRGS